ncbi:MAG: carboxypeptidase regulatory-like domain-containing protein [Planctomycetales bacterium]|nr:carboxypeptidase regulatory-like domain-containing protein [Planctomycetales bacterium]
MTIGCNSGNGPLAITGVVTGSDGQPLASENSQVIFEPVSPGTHSTTATLESDGAFAMTPDDEGRGGVLPGRYKVVVQVFKDYRDLTLISAKKYADAATTPLEATVDASHTSFDFKIE